MATEFNSVGQMQEIVSKNQDVPCPEEGLTIEMFVNNCELFGDKHPDIVNPLLWGLGIDTKADVPVIKKADFFRIFCIIKFGIASQEDLLNLWTRLLDPDNSVEVSKLTVMGVIEKLAGGKCTERPTLISATFSFEIWEYLLAKECIVESGKFSTDVFRKKITNGEVDVNVFNQILKLEPRFDVPLNDEEYIYSPGGNEE